MCITGVGIFNGLLLLATSFYPIFIASNPSKIAVVPNPCESFIVFILLPINGNYAEALLCCVDEFDVFCWP